ncbi:MaoC/PaaZ C-terminal domain-containing protein [Sphingobium estronivorans]|uniref:MaoC/PaaZ C-terminal domain-containing protein n=1 Tax=Sphingobium estronivorans TaxID=1577690 RepID=UPI001239CA56|nr:MaoC/PaaZ C-terminal domain-containing protein [Sphingobium estronivorans]
MTVTAERLPERQVHVTARHVVLGAMASRDWQPQHHDHGHALTAGLPGIILNTPAQTGWFCGYLTDWAGPQARIARWRLRMIVPITPGTDIVFSGEARRVGDSGGVLWIEADLAIHAGATLYSSARFLAALPGATSPWSLDDAAWTPPPLSGTPA